MQVDGARPGYFQHLGGQDAEGHDHEKIGLEDPQGVQETGVAQLFRLPEGKAVPEGRFLHRGRAGLQPPALRPVGTGDDPGHLVFRPPDQRFEARYGEFGRTHVDHAHFSPPGCSP